MELIYLVVGVVLGLMWNRVNRSSKESVVANDPVVLTPPASQMTDPDPDSPLEKELPPPQVTVIESEKSEDEHPPVEEELKQVKLAYQMAHEMSQFKAGFLARTSHELRSPLSSLMGMHQLILSDLCDSPQEEREFVAQAYASAQKMVKLLDEVIAVAKTEHGTNRLEIRSLSLSKVLADVELQTHMQAANRNIQLKVITPEPEIYVLADPRRFGQVLRGIVDSAIAQMEDGIIEVSAASSPDTETAQIWIDVQCPNPIWSESVDLLFPTSESETQPIAPTESFTISPGLMLLMVQTLVQVMQGRLELLALPSQDAMADSGTRNLTRLQCSMPLGTPEIVEQVLVEG